MVRELRGEIASSSTGKSIKGYYGVTHKTLLSHR